MVFRKTYKTLFLKDTSENKHLDQPLLFLLTHLILHLHSNMLSGRVCQVQKTIHSSDSSFFIGFAQDDNPLAVYNSLRSAMIAILNHNKTSSTPINKVACPMFFKEVKS